MALANSNSISGEPVLTDRIAQEDITEENANGQTVVLVPKGQRIPEGIDEPEVRAAPTARTEDKARRSSKEKTAKPVAVDPVE